MNRRTFIKTAGALPACLLGQRSANRQRPNVLFLFTDDQRFDTIQALHHSQVKTPNLDRLVRRGTAFTQAYIMGGTIQAVCSPSRAMLLTGQTLFHVTDSIVRHPDLPVRTPQPFALFPEQFRKAGYETYGIGKWHNGPALYTRCFTRGTNILFGGMGDHLNLSLQNFDSTGAYPASRARKGAKFSSELISDSVISFLQDHPRDKPFLMYAAYTSPHDPRMAPEPFRAMYPPERVELPANFLSEHPFDNGELEVRDETLAPRPRTPQRMREEIASYYAMISEVDAQIGRVLDALEKSPYANNTIIVFAADNGLAVGQHGLLGKQNMYDHSVRVPLVISGPGIPKNEQRDAFCYLLDLFPTLCELAGLPVPSTVEGKSLRPILASSTATVRDSVFFAYRHFQRAVRTQDWKLIQYNANGQRHTQLFDMRNDKWEQKNLAAAPAHKARVGELTALLKKWMRQTDDPLDLDKPGWGYVPKPGASLAGVKAK